MGILRHKVKLVVGAVLITCIMSFLFWNIYHTTTGDIDNLAKKKNVSRILDILKDANKYHPYPNRKAIETLALNKLHDMDSSKFVLLGWQVLTDGKNLDIEPSDIVALAQKVELEQFAQNFLDKSDSIGHTGIVLPNFTLVVDKLSRDNPDSAVLGKIESAKRDKKIKYVSDDLQKLFSNAKSIDTVTDELVLNFKNYGIWDETLEKTLASYKTIHNAYGECKNNISSTSADTDSYQKSIKDADDKISRDKNSLNTTSLNHGYGSLSGYVVGQTDQGTNYDGTKWVEYEIVVAGGTWNGERGILRSYPQRFTTKGYFENIAIVDRVDQRQVTTKDGFTPNWPLYYEIDKSDAKANIQKQNSEKQQIQNEIAQLQQSKTDNQAKITQGKSELNQLNAKLESLTDSQSKIVNQWTSLISSISNNLEKLAIQIVDGKKTN